VVQVTFPSGVHDSSITVTLQPLAQIPTTGSFNLLGQGFSITAVDSGGQAVTQFKQSFTIVIYYQQMDLQGSDPAHLVLHFWDEQLQAWQPLPTSVDTTAQTLTVTLDHLTVFAVLAKQQLYLPMLSR
jgi:hypothetical protein